MFHIFGTNYTNKQLNNNRHNQNNHKLWDLNIVQEGKKDLANRAQLTMSRTKVCTTIQKQILSGMIVNII